MYAIPSSSRHVKSLPTELWMHIFELATHVPNMMDVVTDDPLHAHTFMLSPYEDFSGPTLQSARKSNFSLALVCKQWYSHAMPALFRVIVAKPGYRLRLLRDIIVDSHHTGEMCGPETRSFGSFTHRIELRQGELGVYFDHDDFECLAEILQYLPNLKIFALGPHRKEVELPEFVVEVLLHTAGPSLRRFYVNPKSQIRLQPGHYESIVARCPRLRALYRGGKQEFACAVDLLQASELSFVSVTTTPCTQSHSDFDHDTCSSAQTALFNECTIASRNGLHSIEHFTAVQGRHLRTIFLDIGVTALPGGIQGALNLFEECCPHLEHLIIVIKGWDDLLAAPLRFPPVSRLGIFYDESYGSSGIGGFSDLFTWFAGCDLSETTEVVRLLGEAHVKKLRSLLARGYNAGINNLAGRSYRLEDYEGKAFVPLT